MQKQYWTVTKHYFFPLQTDELPDNYLIVRFYFFTDFHLLSICSQIKENLIFITQKHLIVVACNVSFDVQILFIVVFTNQTYIQQISISLQSPQMYQKFTCKCFINCKCFLCRQKWINIAPNRAQVQTDMPHAFECTQSTQQHFKLGAFPRLLFPNKYPPVMVSRLKATELNVTKRSFQMLNLGSLDSS